jgi:hypothetical protein
MLLARRKSRTASAPPHEAIREWCEANHHKLAGLNWELHGHWQEAWNLNPSLIRTDVFIS